MLHLATGTVAFGDTRPWRLRKILTDAGQGRYIHWRAQMRRRSDFIHR